MDHNQRFNAHFKVPRAELNKIKKEYENQRDRVKNLPADKYKNFDELAKQYFDFFEKFTGKEINRELARSHIDFYLDEGFDVEDLEAYTRQQSDKNDYFKENPQFFTIAKLFSLEKERLQTIWDLIAYCKSKRLSLNKQKDGIQIRVPCGAAVSIADYDQHNNECFKMGGACFIGAGLEKLEPAFDVADVKGIAHLGI